LRVNRFGGGGSSTWIEWVGIRVVSGSCRSMVISRVVVAPVASSLAAGDTPAGAGTNPHGDNATAGTAASGASTPSGKQDNEAANAKNAASGSKSTAKGNDASN
jgi:hypothetical protein